MPIAIRVSDLLTDKGNPQDICPDGDWVNIAHIRFDLFRTNLTLEGFWVDGDTVWLSNLSLEIIDSAGIDIPQPGESRLTSFNIVSILLRTIREHWSKLRNPSPEPYLNPTRSPLPRPNLTITIIIRSGIPKGGALSANQPALNRPPIQPSSNAIIPNRRMEQVARYAATGQAKNKRRREEAAEKEGEGRAQIEAEAEGDVPAAQRRSLMPESAAGSSDAGPSGTAPTPGPSIDPSFALAPAGQDPLASGVDEATLFANLDPTMFNDPTLVG